MTGRVVPQLTLQLTIKVTKCHSDYQCVLCKSPAVLYVVYAPIVENVVPFMVCMISFVVMMAPYSEVELPQLREQEMENMMDRGGRYSYKVGSCT